MATAGLFYVGAVLVLNGVLLLGRIGAREAVPLNLFVGVLQVLTPFVLLARAESAADIVAAAPLYLFGFTYLWVGLNNLFDWPGGGLGWFCGFVCLAALGFAGYNGLVLRDGPFTVIWLSWSLLWGLFFLVLALDRAWLTAPTGWIAILQGLITAAIPAFLMLIERWQNNAATTIAIAAVVILGSALALTRGRTAPRRSPEPVPTR